MLLQLNGTYVMYVLTSVKLSINKTTYFVCARSMQKLEKLVKDKIDSNHNCNIFTQHNNQSVRKLFKATRVGNNIVDYVS